MGCIVHKVIHRSTSAKTHPIAGFTLLEVMVCVVIIATGFMAIYSLHNQTLRSGMSIQFFSKAPLLAQKKIAELETGLNDLSDSEGDFGDDFPGYTYKVTVSDIENETLGETSKNLKKFDLQIILNEGENSYDMTVYRFAQNNDK